ncbi:uncharacterized protein LOC133886238 isoform X3 [Phragmites australis]|uniref:uncharacterized protein LOC133886238 isoform X3 n=1 Tax=Phragmites australis TaxID=29695 RepID=UPI002D77C82E|nr:uncharacterized protein LOC133886238 isoform X3 [Phragmites australis]
MRLIPVQRQRDQEHRRRQAQASIKPPAPPPSLPDGQDGLIASRAKRKGSPCQRDDDSQGGEVHIYSGPSLPEDIWHHIHSLVPMRDAAQAACVSRAFLRSWRCHPNLNFSNETLGLNENACGKDESGRVFYSKVDHIMKRHSGIGVKKLKIQITSDFSAKDSCYLNSWLQTAVTPGIEELTLILIPMKSKYNLKAKYNFPYSLLSNGSGDSIRYLHLGCCSFHPTVTLGCLRSLTRLHLCQVRITGDELGCLLSHSFALERLELKSCDWIVCLKVPCLLQRLSYLMVYSCAKLKLIDNEAPNLSSFLFGGDNTVQLSLGETLQMKNLNMGCSGSVFYARAKLPSTMPNLEALTIYSRKERAHTPMLHSKFIHLRHLSIALNGSPFSPAYDYLSLASFFDAAPSLETFDLDVFQRRMEHVSIFADPADLRQMRELHHHNLKSVKITGFCSAKSLVELTCHIVESITSLECLTLEAPQSILRCCAPYNKSGKCSPMARDILMEAHRAVLAIRTYIEPKVPSTVKLHVLEPCSCHAVEL